MLQGPVLNMKRNFETKKTCDFSNSTAPIELPCWQILPEEGVMPKMATPRDPIARRLKGMTNKERCSR